MELIQGCLNKRELKNIKEFTRLNFSKIVYPDEKIFEKATSLLERHALRDGLRTIDALIASSAISHKATLATANYAHFNSIEGIRVDRFRP
jgi:predicted nucleic acid-binding protein